MRRHPVALMAAAIATLVAAACGSEPPRAGTAATTEARHQVPTTPAPTTMATTATTSSPATSSPATTPSPSGAGSSTTPVSVAASSGTALLTSVRAAHHDGFDRMVFEFADSVPGYEVAYVARPVRQDASGREISVSGAAVLKVRMATASGVDLSASGARDTYAGPDRFRPPGTVVVQELVRTGDFEGTLTWVAGTSTRAPFSVSRLASPPRLVVDVRTG